MENSLQGSTDQSEVKPSGMLYVALVERRIGDEDVQSWVIEKNKSELQRQLSAENISKVHQLFRGKEIDWKYQSMVWF